MDRYRILYKGGEGEIVEKKSRFIAQTYPVTSAQQAQDILECVRKEHWSARHHCWAYRIGRNPGESRMSDDGEPAGTAGKPILEVLAGQDVTDVLVVVIRYFGGTLLGTGGLIRAYTAAAALGLKNSCIAEKIKGFRIAVCADYGALGKLNYIFAEKNVCQLETEYAENVVLHALVPEEEMRVLEREIMESTGGRAKFVEKTACFFILPAGEEPVVGEE